MSFQIGLRKGQNLENLVFIELKRRNKEIYYYKSRNDKEVDFLVKKGPTIKELIQVSYTLSDEPTRKREFAALKAAVDELASDSPIRTLVLTMDKTETVQWKNITIDIVNIIDWLLF